MTTTTVYPEADGAGGATTTDGGVAHSAGAATDWSVLVAAAGTTPPGAVDQDSVKFSLTGWNEHGTSNKWTILERGIVLFTDPGIDAGDVITAATISGYGQYTGSMNAGVPTVNVYVSAPASNTAIVAGDFDSLGSTAFSTGIAGGAISTSGFNDWALNANGLANINKDAISKFGFRDQTYDVADSAPTWQGGAVDTDIRIWSADEDQGDDRRPKLAITHSAAFTPRAIIF